MFNAVKVESVPLKFNFFSRTASRVYPPGIIGEAERVRSHARIGLLIAGGVAVVALTFVALFVAVGMRSGPATSDEDQVRAVLTRMNGSYNSSDFAGFASHLCPDMLRANGYEAGWHQSRESDGPTQITVNSIDVTGGAQPRAVANVQFQAANHEDTKTLDIDFLREGSEWKACRYHAPRAV
ncbi:Rv0361 family membrane protein [Mycobacterium sp. MMS18-G62]